MIDLSSGETSPMPMFYQKQFLHIVSFIVL